MGTQDSFNFTAVHILPTYISDISLQCGHIIQYMAPSLVRAVFLCSPILSQASNMRA